MTDTAGAWHRAGVTGTTTRATHLARRFFGSLVPFGASATDEAWVRTVLSPAQLALWSRMSRPDRRHAAGVARRVQADLGPVRSSDPVLAAALLHDVGKVESGLGTFRRVAATLVGAAAGLDRSSDGRSSDGRSGDDGPGRRWAWRRGRGGVARRWSEGRGPLRRIGLYLCHAGLGADMLGGAGSAELTVAWAREHHLPPDRWSLPPELAGALRAADDD